MVYVRKKLGYVAAHTIACGDSGNDILMLSGPSLSLPPRLSLPLLL
jgi:hydroxymethylpyrimidine pyrophosphatase-like HAD family hydrolase